MGEFSDSLSTVAKGATYIFLGMVISKIFYYLYRMIIARQLGPEIYGLFSLGFSVFTISIIFTTAGVPQGMTRFISKYSGKNDESLIRGTIWSGFELTIPLGIMIGSIIYYFAPFIGHRLLNSPASVDLLEIFALMVPFRTFLSVTMESLKGFKKLSYVSLIEYIFQPLALLIFALMAIGFDKGISGVVTGYLVSLIISSFLGFYILDKKVFPLLKNPLERNHREILNYSLPLIGVGVGATVLSHSSNLIMGWLPQISAAQIGVFNAAWPLATMVNFFGTMFGVILFPVISSKLSGGEQNEALEITSTTLRWNLSISLPFTLFLTIFPESILNLLFGPEYTQGWFILSIVSLAWFFNALTTPISKYLPAKDKTNLMLYNSITVGAASIVLNFLLVPLFGINGAGIAIAFAIIINAVLIICEVIFYLEVNPKLDGFGSVIVSGLISSLIAITIKRTIVFETLYSRLLVGSVIFGTSYIVFFILTGSLKHQDRAMLKKLYSKYRPL